jgi:hypothetical protein
MSLRRFVQILAILSAFAISMSGPLASTAFACDPNAGGGDCWHP